MCFSTEASFGAAAVLGTAGVISLTKVTRRSQIMFAAVPLFFGIQQASEGILWVALKSGSTGNMKLIPTYVFLFFAQMFWPTWLPLSVFLLEPSRERKRILKVLTICGIFCSCILGYRLIVYNVYAEISEHHIHYGIQSPQVLIMVSTVLYVISTCIPCYASGIKGMRSLATFLVLSVLLTKIFYTQYLLSVWCFFGALLSILIISIMHNLRKSEKAISVS